MSTLTHVVHTSAAGRWLSAIDRLPAATLLGLQAVALWPHWHWAAARLTDGSDDPLGVAALAVLALATWRLAPRLRSEPSRAWLAAAIGGTVLATLSIGVLPPLLAAMFAVLALIAGLRAFAPAGTAMLPLGGLMLLALPTIASLQFYAGFPLRVITAQCSTWILQMFGVMAERSGSAMWVDGRLVIVDAPCSGVQMVWMAWFCACSVAWFRGIRDRAFAARAMFVGGIVLAGNILRNSVLVMLEVQPSGVTPGTHEGIGLVALAAVCIAVSFVIGGGSHADR
jgi:exosortase/archaeosortase family protein